MIEKNPPYLNAVSDTVNSTTTSLALLVTRLETELKNSEVPGVGLAAIQLGIFKRVAIIRTKTTKLNLWNPQILERHGSILHSEGCLSLPGFTRTISRSEDITIGNGDGRKYVLYGFDAVVAQHEIDHMDGITIAEHSQRSLKVGRNELCPCGSKLKFKKCHIGKEVELQQLLIQK